MVSACHSERKRRISGLCKGLSEKVDDSKYRGKQEKNQSGLHKNCYSGLESNNFVNRNLENKNGNFSGTIQRMEDIIPSASLGSRT